MGLRGRLTLYFLVITVVPLLLALALLQRQISDRAADSTLAAVDETSDASAEQIESLRDRVGDLAELLGMGEAATHLSQADPAAAQGWLDEQFERPDVNQRVDLALLVTADGEILAAHLSAPEHFGDRPPPAVDELLAALEGVSPPGVLLEARAVTSEPGGDDRLGTVVTGLWVDNQLAAALPAPNAAFVVSDAIYGSSGPVPIGLVRALPQPGNVATGSLAEQTIALKTVPLDGQGAGGRGPGDRWLVVWEELPGVSMAVPLAGLMGAVLAAGGLGWLLAHTVLSPVTRAAEVARAVAAGDLDQRLEPVGGRELASLASALNTMSNELAARRGELKQNRDQLRSALSRLGEMLSSSLDLDRTLVVVTETAMETVGAPRAALLLTSEDDRLEAQVVRGFQFEAEQYFDADTLAGWVARTGMAVRLPADEGVIPQPSNCQALAAQQLCVPMSGTGDDGRIGVLVLARPDDGPPFDEDDLRLVCSFVTHAGIAIENVLLHQETRRLSHTDPMTELWNFRYFKLQASRELEQARAFDRPFGMLIIDLDHFKRINDRYGHPVGDQVLTEVARRIRSSTRAPDIVARYGGEEFVLILPGTDVKGALVTAERIRGSLAKAPIVVRPEDTVRVWVSCSIGVAAYPAHGHTVDELLRRADVALYTAKSQGRDRVISADDAHGRLPGAVAVQPPAVRAR